jgi:hypothetical protein
MAMLVRAGLPSRIAAMHVIRKTQPSFANRVEMYAWLRSNEVTAWTDQGEWPTPETADLWKRFRSDALSGQLQKWFSQSWPFETGLTPVFPGRIFRDSASGTVSVMTPDYQPIVGIRQRLRQAEPGLVHVEFSTNGEAGRIERLGRGEARWVSSPE